MTADSLDRADLLVGRFFRLLGAIEMELNDAIRKLFELPPNSAETVCANIDFFKKMNIVRSALHDQDVEDKHKDEIKKLFGRIAATNWQTKQNMFLLDVFRKKLNFPDLKRSVLQQAALHRPDVVLVEDKASGTSLIQELRADGFWQVLAAPSLEGDKIMRLHGQTAKIESGFAVFPNQAPWLDTYLHELTSFPNAKHDDQVDSTVFALAWSTPKGNAEGWLKYYKDRNEEESQNRLKQPKMFPVWIPPSIGTLQLITGRTIWVPEDRIVEMSEEEFLPLVNLGAKKLN